ncbi:hypothetical protein PV379_01595 [Streptomyces caniscabiei]|uniref:hypothetical protein n=1 Tax=Streptomyces caniscabiei TaxID=2746961 RepID=UPI0029A4219B|nr:hypothetical protein [Streptomyces caniscabiei]MDX2776047.1 hypothetical protein [Streptomyces caniscabiei]
MDDEQLTIEFNPEPSKLSERLIEFVLAKNEEFSHTFSRSGWWSRLRLQFEVENYLQNGWQVTYRKLEKVAVEQDLNGLLKDFEELYGLVMYNNFILARVFAQSTDKHRRLSIQTEEDRRLQLLHELASDDGKYNEYIQQFGHYAFEPFELSDRRFSEYSRAELKKLAGFAKGLKQRSGKMRLESIVQKQTHADIDTLIALREYGKYQCLKLVAQMRERILAEADEHGINNPFSLSWSELMEKVK